MIDLHLGKDSDERERIAHLEVRVAQLESALKRVMQAVAAGRGAGPAQPAAAPSGSGPLAAGASGRSTGAASAQPARSAPVQPAARASVHSSLNASAGPAADAAARRVTLDRLGITAAFEQLDARVAQAAAEQSFVNARGSDAPPVTIDEGLIDAAFTRPPPQKIEVRAGLEEGYPKILARIAMTWRTPEAVAYLNKLIVDERGGRAGFPMEVMSELLLLSSVLEAADGGDRWAANARVI